MIYLFTGQPHAGKTTLAKYLKQAILKSYPERKVYSIDGDDLREITVNVDYSESGRRSNISQAFTIAKYLKKAHPFEVNEDYVDWFIDGCDIIISMVCPYKDLRDELKSKYNVVEIYVHTSDVRGREKFHVENYQPPTEDYIEIDTTNVSEFETVEEMLSKIYMYQSKLQKKL